MRYMKQNLEVGLKFCEKNFLRRAVQFLKYESKERKFLRERVNEEKFFDIKGNSISNRSFHF